MNIATELTCCKCDAMPCGYVDKEHRGDHIRKYYCGFHMRELEENG